MNLIAVLLTWCLVSFISSGTNPLPSAKLQKLIDDFVQSPELKGSDISISLVSIDQNQLVASFQPDQNLIPASSLKLVTTATTLAIFGGDTDFRYSTFLKAMGSISDGVLEGDLEIKGTGDPSLASRRLKNGISLEQWGQQAVAAVQQAGIRQIRGRVIADETTFDSEEAYHPSWEERDMGNYYGTGIWALNIHDNLYYLHFRQNPKIGGQPAIEAYDPEIPGLNMSNQVTSAGKNTGDNAYIYGKPYQFYRKVTGTIPAGSGRFTIMGSFPDAPLFAAQYLDSKLREAGVALGGEATTRRRIGMPARSSGGSVLKEWQSPPLPTLVEWANVNSDNLYCEAFLHSIGQVFDGKGSRSGGLRQLKKLWTGRGLDVSSAQWVDGSGLSEENRISSRLLASILRKAYIDKNYGPAFLKTMPRASNSSYLAKKFAGTPAQYRLYAKSGSMEKVRTYSGFFKAQTGNWYSFSILVNQIPENENGVRTKIEALMLSFCQ